MHDGYEKGTLKQNLYGITVDKWNSSQQNSKEHNRLDWKTTVINLLTYVNDKHSGLIPKYQSVECGK